MNNQITTIEQLKNVLDSVEEYYRFNACTSKGTKEKTLTVSQLLEGAIGIATQNLRTEKHREDCDIGHQEQLDAEYKEAQEENCEGCGKKLGEGDFLDCCKACGKKIDEEIEEANSFDEVQ